MITQRISQSANLIVAAIFLIVGILSTYNAVRLYTYIHQAVPRDVEQTQCNTDTIRVLKGWVVSRIERDAAMDARDIAAQSVLDSLSRGQTPTPEQFATWREAVIKDREVRATAGEDRVPIPNC